MDAPGVDLPPPSPPLCPSARPDMAGALVFGVVEGTAHQPAVTYLRQPLTATPAVLALAAPVEPDEVFRFAAPCAEGACQHYRQARCQLATRVSTQLSPTLELLARCRIRRACRWWQQEGRAACARCPAIVTKDHAPSPDLRHTAQPSV